MAQPHSPIIRGLIATIVGAISFVFAKSYPVKSLIDISKSKQVASKDEMFKSDSSEPPVSGLFGQLNHACGIKSINEIHILLDSCDNALRQAALFSIKKSYPNIFAQVMERDGVGSGTGTTLDLINSLGIKSPLAWCVILQEASSNPNIFVELESTYGSGYANAAFFAYLNHTDFSPDVLNQLSSWQNLDHLNESARKSLLVLNKIRNGQISSLETINLDLLPWDSFAKVLVSIPFEDLKILCKNTIPPQLLAEYFLNSPSAENAENVLKNIEPELLTNFLNCIRIANPGELSKVLRTAVQSSLAVAEPEVLFHFLTKVEDASEADSIGEKLYPMDYGNLKTILNGGLPSSTPSELGLKSLWEADPIATLKYLSDSGSPEESWNLVVSHADLNGLFCREVLDASRVSKFELSPETLRKLGSRWTEDDSWGASRYANALPVGATKTHFIEGLVRTLEKSDPESASVWKASLAK